ASPEWAMGRWSPWIIGIRDCGAIRLERARCREVPHDTTDALPDPVPELRLGGDDAAVDDPRRIPGPLHELRRVRVEGLGARRRGSAAALRPGPRVGPFVIVLIAAPSRSDSFPDQLGAAPCPAAA